MSDPAEDAAQRALDNGGHRLAAAHEALKPIRALHYRVIAVWDDQAFCAECWGPHGPRVWPCDTARLTYSSEELAR